VQWRGMEPRRLRWSICRKTGNYVPAATLAEVDRKIDDGRPGAVRFQFSTYAGAGAPPLIGRTPRPVPMPTQQLRRGSADQTTAELLLCSANQCQTAWKAPMCKAPLAADFRL
jgi:hypothetical protein